MIDKNDYILGVWHCERLRGNDKGYAFVIAKKPKEGNWQLLIKTHTKNLASKEPLILTFDDSPDIDTIKLRAELVFEPAKSFFPDFSEYVEVKGSKEKLLLLVAEARFHGKIK